MRMNKGDPIDRRSRAAPAPPAHVPPLAVPGVTGLLGLAVGVVVIAGLYFAQDVLIPITLAILLSFVLSPIVAALRRWKVPKALAVLVAVLVALGVVGGVGTIVGIQAASLSGDAPAYARTIETKVERAKAFAADRVAFFTRESAHARPAAPAPGVSAVAAATREPVPVRVENDQPNPFSIAGRILGPVLGPFETLIIVLVVAIFILMQKEDLRDRVIRVFGSSDLHRTTLAMDDAGARLSRYFLSQLGVNATFGTVIGVAMWALGMPVPALWGIVAGTLRFVPYIGALLGAVLPLAVAAGIDPGWTMVIGVAVVFAVVEPLTGYVVEPLLYGHSTGLSPLSVVIAAVFWTWIWGPVGLVLSMPLTLCLVVLGRHVPSLEFVDVLLGDRPALTPVEGFYQRMLAGDPAEALEQAGVLLQDRSLSAYYDDVALGGLKLAAADARRGAIDRAGARRIVDAMLTIVDDLDGEDAPTGGAPPDWQAPGSVACIAGRGVLDEAVTAMLAQLLGHRGFGVRRIGHAAIARDVPVPDLAGARLVCLCHLEVGGTSSLRYLVRRLHQASGGAPVMVGLWPEGDRTLRDEHTRQAFEADLYVSTLAAAVDAALALAARSEAA